MVDESNPNVVVVKGDFSKLLAALDAATAGSAGKISPGTHVGDGAIANSQAVAKPSSKSAIDHMAPEAIKGALPGMLSVTPDQWAKAAQDAMQKHPESADTLKKYFLDPANAAAHTPQTGDKMKDSLDAVGASQMAARIREQHMKDLPDDVARDLAKAIQNNITPAQRDEARKSLKMLTPEFTSRDPDIAAHIRDRAAIAGAADAPAKKQAIQK